jgi:aminoglycoside 6'-N-acetyltransferase
VTTSTLRGDRVVLEPLRPEHAERLRILRDAPEVARRWDPAPDGWPLAVEEGIDAKLTITVEGEVAGFVQYAEERDPDYRHADVDIFLGPGHQDRGLGTEAMRVVIRHLLDDRGHHRLTLSTSPTNERAIHVYEKVGFRRVGVHHRAVWDRAEGEWVDELLMELVR